MWLLLFYFLVVTSGGAKGFLSAQASPGIAWETSFQESNLGLLQAKQAQYPLNYILFLGGGRGGGETIQRHS